MAVVKVRYEKGVLIPAEPLELPEQAEVEIVVPLPADSEEEAAWARLTAERFLAGYSEADAIYDRL